MRRRRRRRKGGGILDGRPTRFTSDTGNWREIGGGLDEGTPGTNAVSTVCQESNEGEREKEREREGEREPAPPNDLKKKSVKSSALIISIHRVFLIQNDHFVSIFCEGQGRNQPCAGCHSTWKYSLCMMVRLQGFFQRFGNPACVSLVNIDRNPNDHFFTNSILL